jgi:hypothetical protein
MICSNTGMHLMTTLFPKKGPITIQQGRAGDCYLLAVLDCLFQNPIFLKKIKSMFTMHADGSVVLRIPRTALTPPLMSNMLKKKYGYHFDHSTQEDVITFSSECIEKIDQFNKGVTTNCLAVKLLERITSYYFHIPWDNSAVDASLIIHNEDDRFEGKCATFVGNILNITAHETSINLRDPEKEIKEKIKLMKIRRNISVYMGMAIESVDADGQLTISGHSVRVTKIESPSAGHYTLYLANPHNNQIQEVLECPAANISQKIYEFSTFGPVEEHNLTQTILTLPIELGQYVFAECNSPLVTLLLRLQAQNRQLSTAEVQHIITFYKIITSYSGTFSPQENSQLQHALREGSGNLAGLIAEILKAAPKLAFFQDFVRSELSIYLTQSYSRIADLALLEKDETLFNFLSSKNFNFSYYLKSTQHNINALLKNLIAMAKTQNPINPFLLGQVSNFVMRYQNDNADKKLIQEFTSHISMHDMLSLAKIDDLAIYFMHPTPENAEQHRIELLNELAEIDKENLLSSQGNQSPLMQQVIKKTQTLILHAEQENNEWIADEQYVDSIYANMMGLSTSLDEDDDYLSAFDRYSSIVRQLDPFSRDGHLIELIAKRGYEQGFFNKLFRARDTKILALNQEMHRVQCIYAQRMYQENSARANEVIRNTVQQFTNTPISFAEQMTLVAVDEHHEVLIDSLQVMLMPSFAFIEACKVVYLNPSDVLHDACQEQTQKILLAAGQRKNEIITVQQDAAAKEDDRKKISIDHTIQEIKEMPISFADQFTLAAVVDHRENLIIELDRLISSSDVLSAACIAIDQAQQAKQQDIFIAAGEQRLAIQQAPEKIKQWAHDVEKMSLSFDWCTTPEEVSAQQASLFSHLKNLQNAQALNQSLCFMDASAYNIFIRPVKAVCEQKITAAAQAAFENFYSEPIAKLQSFINRIPEIDSSNPDVNDSVAELHNVLSNALNILLSADSSRAINYLEFKKTCLAALNIASPCLDACQAWRALLPRLQLDIIAIEPPTNLQTDMAQPSRGRPGIFSHNKSASGSSDQPSASPHQHGRRNP